MSSKKRTTSVNLRYKVTGNVKAGKIGVTLSDIEATIHGGKGASLSYTRESMVSVMCRYETSH